MTTQGTPFDDASATRRAILLFAHGARDTRWAEPFLAIAAQMRAGEPGVVVELAFLEMMQPDLATAARRLVDGGAERIDVVPLFLGQGGHLRNDLPPLVAAVRAAHPGIPADAALGIHGRLVRSGDVVKAGDRVELYRPLPADPKDTRRALAREGRTMGTRRG